VPNPTNCDCDFSPPGDPSICNCSLESALDIHIQGSDNASLTDIMHVFLSAIAGQSNENSVMRKAIAVNNETLQIKSLNPAYLIPAAIDLIFHSSFIDAFLFAISRNLVKLEFDCSVQNAHNAIDDKPCLITLKLDPSDYVLKSYGDKSAANNPCSYMQRYMSYREGPENLKNKADDVCPDQREREYFIQKQPLSLRFGSAKDVLLFSSNSTLSNSCKNRQHKVNVDFCYNTWLTFL
jgi:hypothetical protein